MVLNSLFQVNTPLLDDENRIILSPSALCTQTNVNNTSEIGTIFNIFDNDPVTEYMCRLEISADYQNITFTSTLNFYTIQKTSILWIYFGAEVNANRGPHLVLTLQTSLDGTNWTNIDTLTVDYALAATRVASKVYTAQDITFKYIRMSGHATSISGSSNSLWDMKFYEIRYSIK